MVPILLLLTGLAQSTLSKPVMPGQFQSAAELDQREVAGTSGTQVPPNTCAFPVEGTGPVPDDCHRVIDYFSRECPPLIISSPLMNQPDMKMAPTRRA